MKDVKTIGVLTSGGDSPGMNAAIRSVIRTGIVKDFRMMGIRKGFAGLLEGDVFEMSLRSVSDILHRGGTILQTARCPEFKTKKGVERAVEIAKVFGLDSIVVCGGDGSFRGALDLSEAGLPAIGVPCTIDNDIGCSEYTIGFDTALNTVKDAIDKIRDTAHSHERCSVVEVMGRNAGYIALQVGISCGAEVVLIPENEYSFEEDVLKPILEGKSRGKKNNTIIVAEGVGGSLPMAEKIEKITGIETRATILGYIQRGGSPTVKDRLAASRMGAMAVDLLGEGKGGRIIGMTGDKLVDFDIKEGLAMKKEMDPDLVRLARILSM